jgi:hypothetical protein
MPGPERRKPLTPRSYVERAEERAEEQQIEELNPSSAPAPAAPATTSETESEEGGEEWRKFTLPFRPNQMERLEGMLGRWQSEKRVKVSLAEVIRLALDELLEKAEGDPDQVILDLYRQEQAEHRQYPTRKFGRSRGAEQYLKRKGLL